MQACCVKSQVLKELLLHSLRLQHRIIPRSSWAHYRTSINRMLSQGLPGGQIELFRRSSVRPTAQGTKRAVKLPGAGAPHAVWLNSSRLGASCGTANWQSRQPVAAAWLARHSDASISPLRPALLQGSMQLPSSCPQGFAKIDRRDAHKILRVDSHRSNSNTTFQST